MDLSDQGGMPRARIRGEQRVTPLELFFNLVLVFALTQGAEALRGQGTGAGEASAGLLQLKEEEAAVSPEEEKNMGLARRFLQAAARADLDAMDEMMAPSSPTAA